MKNCDSHGSLYLVTIFMYTQYTILLAVTKCVNKQYNTMTPHGLISKSFSINDDEKKTKTLFSRLLFSGWDGILYNHRFERSYCVCIPYVTNESFLCPSCLIYSLNYLFYERPWFLLMYSLLLEIRLRLLYYDF